MLSFFMINILIKKNIYFFVQFRHETMTIKGVTVFTDEWLSADKKCGESENVNGNFHIFAYSLFHDFLMFSVFIFIFRLIFIAMINLLELPQEMLTEVIKNVDFDGLLTLRKVFVSLFLYV